MRRNKRRENIRFVVAVVVVKNNRIVAAGIVVVVVVVVYLEGVIFLHRSHPLQIL